MYMHIKYIVKIIIIHKYENMKIKIRKTRMRKFISYNKHQELKDHNN